MLESLLRGDVNEVQNLTLLVIEADAHAFDIDSLVTFHDINIGNDWHKYIDFNFILSSIKTLLHEHDVL